MTLDLPDLIAGFLIGALFGVVFEDPLKQKWEKFCAILIRILDKWRFGPFRAGSYFWAFGRQTNLFIIDGSSVLKYGTDSIRFRVVEPPPLPDFIEKRRNQELKDFYEGNADWWNGSQLGVRAYSVQRNNSENQLGLNISVYEHDYATFRATSGVLVNKNSAASELDQYKEIVENTEVGQPAVPLASGLGIFVSVMSNDGQIISGVRSSSSGVRATQRDFGICEAIHPVLDNAGSGVFDVFGAALRAVREEVCDLDEYGLDVSVVGFAVDVQWQQFAFVSYVQVNASAERIMSERNLGSSGKWELNSISFDSPEKVFRLMRRESTWDLSLLANYMMICHVLGRKQAKRMIGAS